MAEKNIITKIYRVSIEGAEDLVKKIENLSTNIDKYKLAIKEAKKEKLSNKEDIAQQELLNKKIAESEAEIKRATAERKIASKELQVYVDAQRKAVDQQIKEANQVKALPGSYNALYQEYKKLNQELRNTPETAENFTQIKQQVQGLKTEVDNFNRQFTKDGTLVGEYTTGVLQAFQKAGLDDLIKNQGNLIKNEINKLDKEFAELQKEISEVGVASDGSFNRLEKQLIENRQEANKMQSELERINTGLKGVGGSGLQVTEGLKKGFKDIGNNIAQVAFGLFAFQGGLSLVQDSFTEFDQAETNLIRLQNALKNVGKEDVFPELKQQADELAASLGFIDNDDITKAQEKLVTFGKLSTEQIKAAIPTIIDLASNLGVTIPEASGIFLKAIEGSGKALKEYGINIKDGGTEAERFTILQTELANKVKGSSDALGKSNSGQLRKFKQDLADLKEEIGARLLPILVSFFTFLVGLPWGAITASVIALTTAFAVYRAQLLITAFIQGTLNTSTLAYFVLNNLRIAQQAVLNGLQAAQNFLISAYTAIVISANAATGIWAIAINILRVAFLALTGPVGLIIGLTTALVTVIGVMAAKANGASKGMGDLAKKQAELAAQQRVSAEVTERATKATGEQIAKIRQLTQVATDENISSKTRLDAMNKLIAISPTYQSALDKESINIDKVREASEKLVTSLIEQAKVKAKIDVLNEKLRQQFDLETQISSQETEVKDAAGNVIGKQVNNKDNSFTGAIKSLFSDNEVSKYDKARKSLENLNAEIKSINDEIKNSAELQEELRKRENAGALSSTSLSVTDKSDKAKNLTAEEIRANRIAQLQEAFNNEKVLLETALFEKTITEEQYLKALNQLSQKFFTDKIEILKQGNLKERRQASEVRLEKIKDAIDTDNKLKELYQKQFDEKNKALKDNLDKEKALLSETLETTTNNPNATELQKTQARITFYSDLLSLLSKFNADQEALENSFKFKSVENEKQRIEQIKEARKNLSSEQAKEPKENFEQQLKDAEDAFNRQNVEREENRRRLIAAADGDAKALSNVENNNKQLQLAQEAAFANIRLKIIKDMYDKGLASAEDYYNALKDATDKGNAAVTETFGKVDLGAKIKEAFGLDKVSQDEAWDNILQSAKNLSRDLLNNIFESNQQRINIEFQGHQQKLKLEEEQQLSTAQSEGEKDSIRRKFAKKEKELERQRNIEQQQNAIKKLEIETALGIAKTLATYPFPLNLAFAALTGLAFLIQRSAIERQKFEKGGVPTKTGGVITGASHADGGVPFTHEAEGGELAIINKRSAKTNKTYNVTGTPIQIASAVNELGGGIRFATGAKVRKFADGGFLGSQVKAPVFTPSNNTTLINSNGNIDEKFEAMTNRIEQLALEQSSRIDRLQVFQKTSTVTEAQRKEVQQKELSTV